jgi:DNA processing protein
MQRALDMLRKPHEHVKVLERAQYPQSLKELRYGPPALFYDGDVSVFSAPKVAIVGTRSATTYGKACAYKFAESLAQAGAVVVSGGAMGIDSSAHRGAIAAGGKTISVLGSGVENPKPAINAELFREIRQSGCLLSQCALGTPVMNQTLLARNTLIAALSEAVIVIEAPDRSGALHTAADAAEFGREVFVVPANIDQASFRGSFGLLKDGATLVTHPNDVLNHLNLSPVAHAAAKSEDNSIASKILAVMSAQATSAQSIVEMTGLDAPLVLSELTMLELDGVIIRDAGGYAKKL